MKILVITSKDATNLRMIEVVRILRAKGYEIEVYGTSLDYHNIRMFLNDGFKVGSVELLNEYLINSFDIILCTNDTFCEVYHYKKYAFLLSIASVERGHRSDAGDFLILTSPDRYDEAIEECPTIVVGNPQNKKNINSSKKNYRFLFVDSGHLPRGKHGKRIVANLLLNICSRYPEYELVVKPRFLKNDREVTHENKIHLYDCIDECLEGNELPPNLVLLEEHRDMETLMDISDVVICMYSTSYREVISAHKPLIVIDGIPSEDTFDMRNEFLWERYRSNVKKSRCLVHYSEVFNYLPMGILADNDFAEYECLYEYEAGEKIVDLIEYIWVNCLKENKVPHHKLYSITTFKEEFSLEDLNWDKIFERRIKNIVVYKATRTFEAVDIRLFSKENIEGWIKNNEKKLLTASKDELDSLVWDYVEQRIYDNSNLLIGDDISESFYLNALYFKNKEVFFFMKEDEYLCRRTIHYYKAMYHLFLNDIRYFSFYINKYVQATKTIEYPKYLSDTFYQDVCSLIKDRWVFPFHKFNSEEDRIIIYGAGMFGNQMIFQAISAGYKNILCVVDRKYEGKCGSLLSVPMESIEDGIKQQYDFIVISLIDNEINREIKADLISKGVPESKIISVDEY